MSSTRRSGRRTTRPRRSSSRATWRSSRCTPAPRSCSITARSRACRLPTTRPAWVRSGTLRAGSGGAKLVSLSAASRNVVTGSAPATRQARIRALSTYEKESDAYLHRQTGSLQHPGAVLLHVLQLPLRLVRREPTCRGAGESPAQPASAPAADSPEPPRQAGGRALLLLGRGDLHGQARQVPHHAEADLAGHHAHDGPHGAADHYRRVARHHHRDRRGHLLGDSPVLVVRLLVHVDQLPRLCDAGLLARARSADSLRRH